MLAYKNISSASSDLEKTFKCLFILSKLLEYNQNQNNTINKQCCLDFDVAYSVCLDVPKFLHSFVYNFCIYMLSY